jgi:hypothetical protein
MIEEKIKQCPKCKKWFSLMDLYKDPQVDLLGMNFEKGNIHLNLFYFNHNDGICGTTFTMQVEAFKKLTKNINTQGILAGSEVCELHCLDITDREECHQDCTYASYRWLLNEMINSRKNALK